MSAPSNQRPPSTSRLTTVWQKRGPAAWALWPVSLVYGTLLQLQKTLFRLGWLKAEQADVPVIVVGNVIAGGAGKTPVTLQIAEHLRKQGYKPGILSRGYGRSTKDVREVLAHSTPQEVGDEPLLMARASGMPVFVARQRIDAARALRKQHPSVDILLCDDGLQHTALARDIEVCVFNNQGVGNGFLLPAGPLREAWPRPVDLVLYAGQPPQATPQRSSAKHSATAPMFSLQRQLAPYALNAQGQQIALADLLDHEVHAVAAIARPDDFFDMLRRQGIRLASAIGLPDHYDYDSYVRPPDGRNSHFLSKKDNADAGSELNAAVAANTMDNSTTNWGSNRYSSTHSFLLCTEKDAAKLWPHQPAALAVPLQVRIDPGFFKALGVLLAALPKRSLSSSHHPQP